MKLKYLALAAGMLAATPSVAQISAVASGANAAAVNPATSGAYSSTVYTNNFDSGSSASFSPSLLFATGSSTPGGYYAAPFGDTTQYAYITPYTQTSSTGNSPVTFSTAGLGNFNRVSFYWGSMDSFNVLTFLGAGGSTLATYTGTSFNTLATDDGQLSRYVTFTIDPAYVGMVTGIRFASNGLAAFEIDNFVVGTAVPEAATWAMMMVGLGVVGGAMRRRKAKVAVSYAAA